MSEAPSSSQEAENKPMIMGAIENGNQNVESVVLPNQPRPARDMKGLLKFAMEATAMEDAPNSSNFEPMDPERKKFLEEALKSMTVDLIEVLTKAINTLKTVKDLKPDDDPDEHEEALETITDTVDNVDLANDFHKIGGFDVILPCLTSPHTSLQWRAAELIAELTQNNPYCQSRVLSSGLFTTLLEMVDTGASEAVKVKALYAISCIVRNYPEGLASFAKQDGFSVLLRAMQSDIEKLKVKSAFLLTALCGQHPAIKDDLQKMGWVQQLAALLSQEPTPSHEHLLSAMLALVRDHAQCIEDCRDPSLQLKSTLTSYIEAVKGKEEYQEGVEYAQLLISMVFTDDGNSGER
ncbi:Hsp70-binding protein 1 [Frankliniella fusca]|uniref:Hsp70-binding protein 1 n=1 Tax=Frankliniella fusca TaxID=407009 RepID=A0AAE1LHD8_9NEOP|nr:Hsp70-binding protein 1 [Frankliniella fusca]